MVILHMCPLDNQLVITIIAKMLTSISIRTSPVLISRRESANIIEHIAKEILATSYYEIGDLERAHFGKSAISPNMLSHQGNTQDNALPSMTGN